MNNDKTHQKGIEIQKYFCKKSFLYFLNRGFYELNPGQDLKYNWHLKLITEYLNAVKIGKIKRLIINMPPRHLKSITVNVLWSAWILGHNPKSRIISASYSGKLSEKHNSDVRQILKSPWYKSIFPNTKVKAGQDTKSKIVTTQNGFRIATSVGGTLTGEGGDIIIIDDPHTPLQVQSIKYRAKVIGWFDQTLLTRLNNPKNGKIVLVMQRLHDEDLSGHLISKKKWVLLSIPAISCDDEKIQFGKFSYFRAANTALCEEMLSLVELDEIKKDIGSYAFAAQYLQNPVKLVGAYIKQEWIQDYNPESFHFQEIYQSWDSAFKTGAANDYSVCVTVAISKGKIYLLDVLKVKLEFSDLKHAVYRQFAKHQPQAVLIEDKASGQALIQDISRKYATPIIKIRPKLDKISRFMQSVNLFEAGKVYIPKTGFWYADFMEELMSFPNVLHDDQVDALTQFLNWYQSRIVQSVRGI